ncbi:MAG: TrmB family transcriptional regulator [Candidatus Thorarchaeota archaeon]|nr:TrmB family transcriptional regulator [Candidatus Thorarchaeota archaeon]
MKQEPSIDALSRIHENDSETLHHDLVHVLGLTPNEARAYVHLLGRAPITPGALSQITKIHRSRIYDNLKGLESKGLILKTDMSPLRYEAVSPELAVAKIVEQLNRSHTQRVYQISALSLALQSLHDKTRPLTERSTTKLIPLEGVVTELSKLLEKAKSRVWVSKRALGGVVDWYLLRPQLEQLVSLNADIRFISDTAFPLPFGTKLLSDVPLSFALVDDAVMTFLFSSSTETDQVILSENKEYVDFFAQIFSDLWSAAE